MPETVPRLSHLEGLQLSTGCTDEVVAVVFGVKIAAVYLTPLQARSLATLLLALADQVDGGRGVN